MGEGGVPCLSVRGDATATATATATARRSVRGDATATATATATARRSSLTAVAVAVAVAALSALALAPLCFSTRRGEYPDGGGGRSLSVRPR